MIHTVYCDRRFQKRLASLRRAGGISSNVARRVEDILEHLRRQDVRHPGELRRMTRYGDARIRNCIKYDLGNGFRLVCMRRDRELFLLFIGDHDECDRWLGKNKGLEPVIRGENILLARRFEDSGPISAAVKELTGEEDEYEQHLMEKIDDRMLRSIFCGLCGGSSIKG